MTLETLQKANDLTVAISHMQDAIDHVQELIDKDVPLFIQIGYDDENEYQLPKKYVPESLTPKYVLSLLQKDMDQLQEEFKSL